MGQRQKRRLPCQRNKPAFYHDLWARLGLRLFLCVWALPVHISGLFTPRSQPCPRLAEGARFGDPDAQTRHPDDWNMHDGCLCRR